MCVLVFFVCELKNLVVLDGTIVCVLFLVCICALRCARSPEQ